MHTRLLLVALLALAACAGGKVVPPAAPAAAPVTTPAAAAPVAAPSPLAVSGLEFVVEPATAQILVDGDRRGSVAELASGVLGLAPGIYQVSLSAPGYVPWRAEVAIRTGRERIEVTLARRGPGER